MQWCHEEISDPIINSFFLIFVVVVADVIKFKFNLILKFEDNIATLHVEGGGGRC